MAVERRLKVSLEPEQWERLERVKGARSWSSLVSEALLGLREPPAPVLIPPHEGGHSPGAVAARRFVRGELMAARFCDRYPQCLWVSGWEPEQPRTGGWG